jgi:hypothetical protein
MAEEQAEAQWRLARNDANNPRDLTDVTKRQQQSVEEHFHKLKADFARAQLNAPRAEAATASPSLGNAHARAVTGDAVQARMAESAENKRLRDEAESIVLKRWAHLEQDAGALSTERAINRNALIQKQTEQEFLRLLKKSIDSQIR